MFRCCKECNKRYVGCHAQCRAYQKTKKEHMAESHAKHLDNLVGTNKLYRSFYKRK